LHNNGIEKLVGPSGNTPILIRDDDTNFFTRVDMLETVYSKAWNDGFKISLSVVPMQICFDDLLVPPQSRYNGKFSSITDNTKLVEFLKNKVQKESVEILQHGFSHGYYGPNRGEFAHYSKDHKCSIEEGRNVLGSIFGTNPTFFVPPYEDISKENLDLICMLGMVPIYRNTGLDKFLRSPILPIFLKSALSNRIFNQYRKRYLSADAPNFGVTLLKASNIEVDDIGIRWHLPADIFAKIKTLDDLIESTFDVIQRTSVLRRPLCILNHYHMYFYDWNTSITSNNLFNTWNKILEFLGKIEYSWKASFIDLYTRARKIKTATVVKTGSKITIKSQNIINEFSIRVDRGIEANPDIIVDKDTNIVTIEQTSPHTNIVIYEK
jgi:peptidoglycan/xylan/chitin deacetylase (PgdA/CDA1 family)